MIPESSKVLIVKNSLCGSCVAWYDLHIDDTEMTYNDFKAIFKEHYWDIRKQVEIRNKVINGYYNSKRDSSMSEHLMKMSQITKFLEPPIEEWELISLIVGHFPSEIRSVIIVARPNTLKEPMKLLKDLKGHNETNRNREINPNEEGNSRVPAQQGRNDRQYNNNRYQNRPQFISNNHANNDRNYQNRNYGNHQNGNNNDKRIEKINQIEISNQTRDQEVNHRNRMEYSREQISNRGNSRGRMTRGGQRVRYSDQERGDDRSDRSPSPDEGSNRINHVRDEHDNDSHDLEGEDGRRMRRESPQSLN